MQATLFSDFSLAYTNTWQESVDPVFNSSKFSLSGDYQQSSVYSFGLGLAPQSSSNYAYAGRYKYYYSIFNP